MSLTSAECGVSVGDEVSNSLDDRFECPAIRAGVLFGLAGLHELGLPDDERTKAVYEIDGLRCSRIRELSEDPDSYLNFACPEIGRRAIAEIREMAQAGYLASDLREALRLVHPLFRRQAEFDVWDIPHPPAPAAPTMLT